MTKVTLPDPNELSAEDQLSEEQLAAIEEAKNEDWSKPAEESSEKQEDDQEDKKDVSDKGKKEDTDDKSDASEEEEKPDDKTPEDEEAEKAESERLEKKAKKLNKSVEEVKQIETEEKAEQERLEKVAKDEGLTVEEVKELEKKDMSIAERHGNDPVKIARALRKEQSEYGKLKNEVEQLKAFKTKVETAQTKFNERQFNDQMEKGREDIIDKFRDKFPDEAEDLSDDACFERGKALIRKALDEKQKETLEKQAKEAEVKRKELVKGLPDEHKDYAPEVKEILAECADGQILDKEFDVIFIANYARGKKFTPDYVKSLGDAAYKRGVEKPKMIPKVPGARPKSGGKDTTLIDSMSEQDKARAIEIYGRREGWSKERMYEEYAKNDKDKDF